MIVIILVMVVDGTVSVLAGITLVTVPVDVVVTLRIGVEVEVNEAVGVDVTVD